jgi:hypothetical protein
MLAGECLAYSQHEINHSHNIKFREHEKANL